MDVLLCIVNIYDHNHTSKKPCHELIKETCQNAIRMKRNRYLIAAIVLLLLVFFVIKFNVTQVLVDSL